jgi:hypothetical protein
VTSLTNVEAGLPTKAGILYGSPFTTGLTTKRHFRPPDGKTFVKRAPLVHCCLNMVPCRALLMKQRLICTEMTQSLQERHPCAASCTSEISLVLPLRSAMHQLVCLSLCANVLTYMRCLRAAAHPQAAWLMSSFEELLKCCLTPGCKNCSAQDMEAHFTRTARAHHDFIKGPLERETI